MNVSFAEKKVEALNRMRAIGYWGRARNAFRQSGKVFVNDPPFGGVYDMEPEVAANVKKFEAEHNALVYMIARAYTEFGKMDSYIYVSDNKDDWAGDNDDLRHGISFAYTVNKDAPDCSEFGSIGFKMGVGAGMVRTA